MKCKDYKDFHSKIDNFPNYIIVMTLKNKDQRGNPYMLAMYSERPLNANDKTLNTGKGFVSSVTNKTSYHLLPNNLTARLTDYNDYFVSFGKGEVQFKIGTSTLMLNVGHNYKSFDVSDKNTGLEVLTGRVCEESEIDNY
jgi:hypothetical protein